MPRLPTFCGAACIVVVTAGAVQAQSSSLFQRDLPEHGGQVLRLSNTSWSYQELPPPRQIQLNDIITVSVDEKSTVTSAGKLNRNKTAQIDAELTSWIKLHHGALQADPLANGAPKAVGTLNNNYKADAEIEASDGLAFKIAAKVLDIRPNGTLIIEGHRLLKVNEEEWELSLTGTVAKEKVAGNLTVRSEDIADLDLKKCEKGDVRDGYRRGWMLKAFDKFSPF